LSVPAALVTFSDAAVQAMTPEAARAAFAGRRVIVEAPDTSQVHRAGAGPSRSRAQARADLLAALDAGSLVRLPTTLELVLGVLLAGGPAAAQAWWGRRVLKGRDRLRLPAFYALYLVASWLAFQGFHLLLDVVEGGLTLLLAWYSTRLVRWRLLR
jgi:hypothetical protein